MWKIVDGYDGYEVNEFGTIRNRHTCNRDGFVVDHIDNNPWNNHYTNLRWVTQKFNVERSPIGFRRHKDSCILCVGGCEYPFDSYASASRFASKEYGASYSMLVKWHRWHDITIKCND